VSAALLLAALLLAGASAEAEHPVAGLWRTPTDGGSLVRLEACGRDICGAIVSSPKLKANPDQRDQRNAQPSLRGRPLKGLRILQASPTAPGHWTKGWVYNPEDGKTYQGEIRLLPDGRLKLTGCVVKPLCKTQVWVRAPGG
jgi:uncharacterized protein (DUF2147 family)